MNPQQVQSIIRWGLTALSAWGVAKGWFDHDQAASLTDAALVAVGPVVALVTLAWGIFAHRPTAAVQHAADAIVADPSVAQPVVEALRLKGAVVTPPRPANAP